jgi:hypothetical protein
MPYPLSHKLQRTLHNLRTAIRPLAVLTLLIGWPLFNAAPHIDIGRAHAQVNSSDEEECKVDYCHPREETTGQRIYDGGNGYIDSGGSGGESRSDMDIGLDPGAGEDLAALALKSPDARCNPLATSSTRNTFSTSDANDRFLAAQQLLSAITAQTGVTGAQAAVKGSPKALYDGVLTPTFSVTYGDGGTERWFVATLVPVTLIINGNVPDSLKVGSGKPEQCPTTAKV